MPRVSVQCSSRVTYHRYVEMTDEDWAAYNKAIDDRERDRWFADFVEKFIDPVNDAMDWDEYEDVEVELAPKSETAP